MAVSGRIARRRRKVLIIQQLHTHIELANGQRPEFHSLASSLRNVCVSAGLLFLFFYFLVTPQSFLVHSLAA